MRQNREIARIREWGTEEPGVVSLNRAIPSNVLGGVLEIPSCGGGINPTGDSGRKTTGIDRGVRESSVFWYCALSAIDGDTIPLLFKGVVSCGGAVVGGVIEGSD